MRFQHYFLALVIVGLSMLGGAALVGGELDDSPGLGGLGLLMGLVAFVLAARRLRGPSNRS